MTPERCKSAIYGVILSICVALSIAQSPDCRTNEELRICGSNCPMTCDSLDTNVCCDVKCIVGCICKDGFIRADDSMNAPCISLNRCPKPGTVQFHTNSLIVPENIGVLRVKVVRTDGTKGQISVKWRVRNNTAISFEDFTAVGGTIMFKSGQTEATIDIIIIDDNIRESMETFSLELYEPSNKVLIGRNRTITITILDNDAVPGVLQFRVSQSVVSESSPNVRVTVVRVMGSDGTVRVRFTTVDKTALRRLDFEPASGELEFPDGVTEKVILVKIIDDTDREDDEEFVIQLFDPSGGATLGLRKTHTITILDDDSKPGVLQFEKPSVTVSENSAMATLTVVRQEGSDGEVSVKWQTQDLSAVSGEDYTEFNGILVFGDGITEKRLEVPILDDSNEEPTENFLVELFEVQGGARIGPNNPATVIIQDDDEKPSVIQFKRRRGSVRENSGVVRVPVTRSVNFKHEVSVHWRTVARTAKVSTDFVGARGKLTFAIDEREKNIEIIIIDDDIQETNELFDIVLFQPSANAVIGVISKFTVEILDDDEDPPQFSFESTHLIVSEADQQARLIVVRTGAMKPATVWLRTIDQTAIGGVHFESTNSELRFVQNQIKNVFLIEIFGYDATNSPRTFQAELFAPSSGGVVIGGKATIIIDDIDVPANVQEDATMPAPTTETVEPTLPPATLISCPAGLIWKGCSRTCPESCENLKVKTSCLVNTMRTFKCIRGCFCSPGFVLAAGSANKCIRPSECLTEEVSEIIPTGIHLSFRDINIKVKESAGHVLLPILRSGGGLGTVTCFWRIIDVTAILKVHYRVTVQLQKLILAPTDLEKTIRIEIIDNDVSNPARVFKVELFSLFATDIFVPGRNIATVTIEDDDDVLIQNKPDVFPTAVIPPTHISDVITKGCPPGLILKECERSCPSTCDDWQSITKPCGSGIGRFPSCVRGCFCPRGLLLNQRNGAKCVRPSDCGCPPTMIKSTCKPACELSCDLLVCPRQHTLIPNLFGGPQSTCVNACVCPDGMVLEKRGGHKCVHRSSCTFVL